MISLNLICRLLIAGMKRRFLEAGGTLYEHTTFKSCETFQNGVVIR